jgi:hypothetical protein
MLDFVIGSDGLIWVLLDGKWDEAATTGKMVRVVRWDSVVESVSAYPRFILNNLFIHFDSSKK